MNALNAITRRVLAVPIETALVLVLASIGTALLFQHVGGYSPCALCIIQRLAMTAVALLLLAARLGRSPLWRGGLAAGAGVVALGATIAGLYQVYLNIVPGMSCSARLMLTINELPPAQLWPNVYSASGDCVLFNPTVFELALPYAAVGVDALLVLLCGLALRQATALRGPRA
ncbi:MAG: disulfide bond formation protein B [Burkholderiaceae bacterium]